MERRRETRFKPSQTATLRALGFHSGPLLDVSVLDISASGMRLRSRLPFACGSSVEIELDHATSRGTVCRCEPLADNYELGIQVLVTRPKKTVP